MLVRTYVFMFTSIFEYFIFGFELRHNKVISNCEELYKECYCLKRFFKYFLVFVIYAMFRFSDLKTKMVPNFVFDSSLQKFLSICIDSYKEYDYLKESFCCVSEGHET